MKEWLFKDFNEYIIQSSIADGALMIVGIDNLREINAAYGIEIGDKIIANFSNTLLKLINPEQVFKMDNSDEFILIFDNIQRTIEGEQIFSKLQKLVLDDCKELSYIYTVSAGMVLFHNLEKQNSLLLPCAEYALNRAKDNGKNCLFIYDKEQFNDYIFGMDLLKQIKLSIQNNFEGFELFYQPLVSLETQSMIGAEALLRWNNPAFKGVSIARVISLLEESGLIIDVEKFIIEQAMIQTKLWNDEGHNIIVHINLSYVQFLENDCVENIVMLSKKTKVNPNNISFEITESGFAGSSKIAVSKKIQDLKNLGFGIALDDFGTGYSNFIYLKDMNVSLVKLDRIFINEAIQDKNKFELVRHMVEIAHSSGMKICFEGVETPDDLKYLSSLEPDLIQGYVFGKPIDKVSFNDYFVHFLNEDALEKCALNKKADTSMAYIMNEISDEENENKLHISFIHKALLTALPILLVVMFGLFWICYSVSNNILWTQLETSLTTKLEGSVDKLDSKFLEIKSLAKTTSVYVTNTYESADRESYESSLNDIVSSNSNIAGCGIWFEHGAYQGEDIMCPYTFRKDGEIILTYYYGGDDYDYFSQYYYAECKRTLKPLITDPYYDDEMGSKIITFSEPMIDDGTFIGVITVDLYLNDVIDMVNNLNPDKNTHSFIVSNDNSIICGFSNAPSSLIGKMGDSDGSFDFTMDDVEYKVYFDTLQSTGWKTAMMVNIKGIDKPVRRIINVIIITFALTFISSLAIIGFLLLAINRQKRLEHTQKKNNNDIHFNVLKTSYHLIAEFDEDTINVIHTDDAFKRLNIDFSNYISLISSLQKFAVNKYELSEMKNLDYVKHKINENVTISDDIELSIVDNEKTWVEISISKYDTASKNNALLLLVRDINDSKTKEIESQREKLKLILELQEKNNELFEMGMTDTLTGIYNRAGLNHYATTILEEARSKKNNLFLLIADIDKLKNINDFYGHLKGDEAIVETARILKQVDSKNLIAARTGGDEFVLIGCFDEKDDIPSEVINNIKNKTSKSKLKDLSSGISVGYYWGKLVEGKSLEYYYRLADVYMYKNKNSVDKKSKD